MTNDTSHYHKKKRRVLFLCLTVLLLIGSVLIAIYHKKATPKPAPSIPAIKVTTSTIALYKEYIGITQSISAVAIRARVEGFLLKKQFIEGTIVKENQLLYVIDKRPYEAQLAAAMGTLAKSIANQDYQHVEYIRMQQLVKKGDVSQSEYDKVDAQYQAAVGEVEVARAQVALAKINLGYCSMFSPFKGLIGKKYVDLGNLVGGSEKTLLVNVVQLDPIYVQFSPSINDYGEFMKYRANMPFSVKATLPGNNKLLFKGKVDLVNNEANVPTSTILMRGVIENSNQLLLPGIYVNVSLLLTNNAKVLLIPSKAIIETQGQQNVLVLNKKNQVEVRSITMGEKHKQQQIIQSGLKVGDVVLIDDLQKIKPGMVITPIFSKQKNG